MSSSPYQPAARLLEQIWQKKCSLKSVAYDKDRTLRCSKRTYAQVCHVLQHQALLERIRKRVPSLEVKNEALLYVLMYELLLGPKKEIQGGGALKRKLLKVQEQMQQALEEIGVPDTQTTEESNHHPRYIRVNTLQTTTEAIIQRLKDLKIPCWIDAHVPDLLVVPPSASSQILEHFSHELILQDKSSCFPALCLDPSPDATVLDACAAPGNKTSQLAARFQHVLALDRDSKRCRNLQRRMQQLCGDRVTVQHADFLQTTPDVKAVLLDPTCSGSGLSDAKTMSDERLRSLANFQSTCLKHALSLPHVTQVVYSTCSVHEMENEGVVVDALQDYQDKWHLVPALRSWHRRGRVVEGLTEAQAQCLVRVDPSEDGTHGFFVAAWRRKSSGISMNETECPTYGLPLYEHGVTVLEAKDGVVVVEPSTTVPNKKTTAVQQQPDKKNKSTTNLPDKKKTNKPSNAKAAKKRAWKQQQHALAAQRRKLKK